MMTLKSVAEILTTFKSKLSHANDSQLKNDVTIAANILLKGLNYSDSVYTNIFCDYDQLTDFLLEEATLISKQVFEHKTSKNEIGTVQIDLHNINGNKPWLVNSKFILQQVDSADFAFTCYRLKQSIK